MAKIGVGVGEEFPINDRPENGGAESGPGPDARQEHCCGWDSDEDYEDWRAWREERRARRHEWRARRREWRRRYREEMRARYAPGDPLYYYWGLPRILRIIVWIAVVVLVLRIVAHAPLIILAAALLGVFYLAHRHHEEAHYRDTPPSPPSGGR